MPLSTDLEARKKRLISYVFAVFVLGSAPDKPHLLIDSNQQPPPAVSGHAPRGTYRTLEQAALLIAGFLLIAIAGALLPKHADAFWPFSDASAAANASLPDASTPALAAATNLDPNPTKGLDDLQTADGSALVAYSGPSGTIADVTNAAPPDRISVYVVRAGDTLSEIAAMFSVSVNTIIWANDLAGPNDVHPGDTLIILPVSGLERTVVSGDTLKSIAKKYSADPTEIAQYNGLDPAAALAVGSVVIIPGGEIATPTASVSSATKSTSTSSSREPYLGGSGPAYPGYYESPVVGGTLTQGLHGWNAVDIGSARGTPIHAAANGVVIVAKNNGAWNGGYGNYVVISHGNGTQTLYAHMSHAIVSPGQTVSQGQTIGYVGMTGETTGPHVHFEIRGAKNIFAATCSTGESVGAFSCQ